MLVVAVVVLSDRGHSIFQQFEYIRTHENRKVETEAERLQAPTWAQSDRGKEQKRLTRSKQKKTGNQALAKEKRNCVEKGANDEESEKVLQVHRVANAFLFANV